MPVRVMLVDDQALVRSGLRAVLEAADGIDVVAEAGDGADAIPLVREHRPDVVLMDLNMPRIGGVEATLHLLRLPDPPRVLVLTTFNTDDMVMDALQAGASGFLLKDLRAEELEHAVRCVAAGGTSFAPQIMTKLVARARGKSAVGRRDLEAKIASLTDSERAIIALLGKGMTNQQIAEELNLAIASVKTYVSRMLVRLGLENRTQAAILAYEAGYVGK
ncbi:response regulator transcription factor [Streptomyces sp. TRM66268-LWL]|uniref:Response regulator transcription factor n=1 Tax=Streptomyces polyasparticus TaxID=2767826 RepID=A0ABR7SVK1_9ACTN|nr:response regulator transcription factor [Streptomyces polyasparticus]